MVVVLSSARFVLVFPLVAARERALSAGNGDIAVMAQFRLMITDWRRLWSSSVAVVRLRQIPRQTVVEGP